MRVDWVMIAALGLSLGVSIAAAGCDDAAEAGDAGAGGRGGAPIGGAPIGGAPIGGAPIGGQAGGSEVSGPLFDTPQAVAFAGDRLVVSNTAIDQMTFQPGAGFVTVIDVASWQVVNKIPTTQPNPQRLVVHGDALYVVNTGTLDFSDFNKPLAAGPGGIDVIPLAALDTATAALNVEIPPAASDARVGGPVDLAFMGDVGVVTLAAANAVLLFDSQSRTMLRSTDDPLWLGEASWSLALGSVAAGARLAYVVDFNADRMWVVDPAAAAVSSCWIELGASGDLEGAQTPRLDGDNLFYTMSISGQLLRLPVGDLELEAGGAGECAGAPAPEVVVEALGGLPNDLLLAGGALYVVHSGDNNVVAYGGDGAEADRYVLMPGANAWHVAASGDTWLAVSEYLGDAVTVFGLQGQDEVRIAE